MMNWVRLLEIIAMAGRRVGPVRRVERGYQWVCYCAVCCALRALP